MLLIFDLDGTLVDSRDDICTAVNLTRSRYGLPPLPVEIVSGYIGDGMRKLLERALEGVEFDIDEAVQTHSGFYMQHLHDMTIPYPGVIEGLSRLRGAGHTLAVLSNKPSKACFALLDHFRALRLFAEVIGGDDCARLKPDPAPVLMIMQKTGFSPGHAWLVGDSRNDIEAARRAGARSAFVRYGIGRADGTSPDKSFDTFEELTDFFTQPASPT